MHFCLKILSASPELVLGAQAQYRSPPIVVCAAAVSDHPQAAGPVSSLTCGRSDSRRRCPSVRPPSSAAANIRCPRLNNKFRLLAPPVLPQAVSSSCPRRLSRRLPTAKDKDANQGLARSLPPTRSLGARNNGQNAFLHLSEMNSFTHAGYSVISSRIFRGFLSLPLS